MSIRPSNSRQNSNPSASIFSKQKPPIPTKDVNLPSISVSKPNLNPKSSVQHQEPEEEPQEMYQNPLYHGHFHDENLGHEHIPGEFDTPEQELESESQQPEDELKKQDKAYEENVVENEEEEDLDYMDQRPSQFSEGNNNNNNLKKPTLDDQGRMSKRIFDSKLEKVNVDPLPEVTGSVRGGVIGSKVEKYELPNNQRYENITINTQQILDKTQKESVRLSALMSNAQNLSNNKQPLLSIMMSPQQQEIYYKMFYLKANTSVGIRELALVSKRDSRWYVFLEEKAAKLKERLRDESKILSYMIESFIRIKKHHDSSQETLLDQKKKLYHMASIILTRRVFEEKLRFEMDYLRHKLEESHDLEKEADLLIAIFSTLSDEASQIRTSVINEVEQHKDIHTLALKKYDEYHDYVNKLDIALQDYRKYLRIDPDSDEFKRKVQSLLHVLTECDEYSKRTYQEIRALNLKITRELQTLIDRLRTSNFDYQTFFRDLEDSSNIVSRLIYIRLEKLPHILEYFDEIDQDFSYFRLDQVESQKALDLVDKKLRKLRTELKGLKKLAKNLRDDPKSQLFINLRLKQTQSLVFSLKTTSNRVNAYLSLVAYLRENQKKIIGHIQKFHSERKEMSHEEKSKILGDLISTKENLEMKQAKMWDLKKQKIFSEVINQLENKCATMSDFKPLSLEKKELIKKLKDFNERFIIFDKDCETSFQNLNKKLDFFDFMNLQGYEKSLELLQIQQRAIQLLEEGKKYDHVDLENSQDYIDKIKDLQKTDDFCRLLSDSVLQLINLKIEISGMSFSRKDFSKFCEILEQTVKALSEMTNFFRNYKKQLHKWQDFIGVVYDFLNVFRSKLSGLESNEAGLARSFEKGLVAFLKSKSLRMNKYLEEFTKDWDNRFRTMNELKSLGSRASTIKELDDQINRKRLASLIQWHDPKDVLDVLIFKEYVKGSEPKNKKLVEEVKELEEKIKEYYQTPQDFLGLLEADQIHDLISHLNNIFGVESQDFEVMLKIYKKAIETQETLRREIEDNVGHTLKVKDNVFKDSLMRFNEETRKFYEDSKKEVYMILDTVKNKGISDRMKREMKDLFQRLEGMYFEHSSFSLQNITEFVQYAFFFQQDNILLKRELGEMNEILLDFSFKKKNLGSDWEQLKPNFTRIMRILSAFCHKDILELLKNPKKNREILFFHSAEDLEEIKDLIRNNRIELWYKIWTEIFEIVALRRDNNVKFGETMKNFKKKVEDGEYKGLDATGILTTFVDVLGF